MSVQEIRRPNSFPPAAATLELVKAVLRPPVAMALRMLARWSTRRVGLALVYHGIAPTDGSRHTEILPPLDARVFEAQVRHLARHFQVVPASQLVAATRERRRGRRFPVAITLDDDLASHRELAMPILRRARVPATFFLSGVSLDGPFSFWWERLQRAVERGLVSESGRGITLLQGAIRAPGGRGEGLRETARAVEEMPPHDRAAVAAELASKLGPDPAGSGLREEDVRMLVENGFEIGFHTLRHDALPALDDDGLARAMSEGRARLAAVVGRDLDVIAYPHGKADARVAAAARAAGYAFGFTTSGEAVLPTSDPLLLGRAYPASPSTGRFALQLARALAYDS